MTMDDVDALSNADLPQNAQQEHEGRERVLTSKGEQWQMVNLHSVGDISHAQALFTVGVRHHCDFVASLD